VETTIFEMITRSLDGVAAYVGRIVLWVYSDVRPIAGTTPSSMDSTTLMPITNSAISAPSFGPSGTLPNVAASVTTTKGNRNAPATRILCDRIVRSLIHSERIVRFTPDLPTGTP